MAQCAGVDISDSDVERIRAEYGEIDAETTVDDYLGRNDCDESDEDDDDDDCDGDMTMVAKMPIFTSVSGGTKN